MSRQQATNLELGVDTARANLITNGGLEVWQRGNGPFSTNGTFAADGWMLYIAGGGPGLTVTPETTIMAPGSARSAKCVVTGTGGTQMGAFYCHAVKDMVVSLRGRVVSLSAWVRTAVPSAAYIRPWHTPGTLTQSAFHTGNDTWQLLTVTQTIGATATDIHPELVFQQPGTFYIDNVMLVVGSVAADYAPLHPADDLMRCQRYYEIVGVPGGGDVILRGPGLTGAYYNTNVRFRVPKPVVPAVTKVGTWVAQGLSQPVAQSISVEGFRLEANVTAVQPDAYTYNQGGGATVTVEANP